MVRSLNHMVDGSQELDHHSTEVGRKDWVGRLVGRMNCTAFVAYTLDDLVLEGKML